MLNGNKMVGLSSVKNRVYFSRLEKAFWRFRPRRKQTRSSDDMMIYDDDDDDDDKFSLSLFSSHGIIDG